MIALRNLSKEYVDGPRVVRVLSALDLEIGAGERVAIVGESGVGKSTLLHILGTLERRLFRRVDGEWPGFAEGGPFSGALLDGIHRLCQLTAHMLDDRSAGRPEARRETWTLLRTRERAAVMELVGRWLADWPVTWMGWAKKHGLTRHYLEVNHGPWPAWVRAGFVRLPYSFGVVGIRRPRARGFGLSRSRFASAALWREARAKTLLRRAGMLGGRPK